MVLRCLEKEPVHRYRSCAELAEELERLLRGEAVDARSVPALARRWRALGSRRQRALRLLALSLSLCVLVTAAGWLLLSLGSPRRFEEALGAELPLGHSLAPNALARLRSYAQRPFVAWLGGGDAERTRAGLALVEGLSALERGDEAAALDALRRYEALRLALDARKQVPLTAERVAHRALRGAVAALAARGERDVPRGDLLAAREDLEAALREGLYLRGPANLPLLHALVLARLGDPRFAGDALEAFEDSFAASAGGDESSAHPRLQDLDAPALRALAWAAAQTGEKHRHAAAVEGLLARGALEGPDLAAYLSLLEPVEASRWLDEHAPPGERPWSLRRRKPSPSAPATDRPGVRGPWPTRLAGAEALRPLAARLLRQAVPDPAGADALELAARREAFVGLLDLQEGERRRASLRVACWLGAEHAAAVRRALAAGPRSVEDAASSQTVAFDELLETLAAFAPKGPHGENSELVAVLNLVHGNLLGRPAALASLLPYFEASLAEGCRGEVGPSLRCLAADAYLALASEGGSPKERRKLCRKRCRELLAPLRARSSHPLPKERRSVARALSVLGRSYWQEGRYREAFAAFEHAESLDPLVRGLPGHLRARAESLDRTGRGEAALRAFEDYLENFDVVTPGVVHAAERCYAFWRASKDRASVRRCGERVLERSPRSALAHRWRCRLALLELEDYRARNGAPNPEGSVAPWGSPEGNAARKYLAEAQRGFTTLMAKARSDAQRRAAAAELRRTTRALRLLNRGSPEVFEALERLCAPTEGP
ncbi:MAG: hypothetical protein D6731_17900 [Planctomycetota bacterium]|nr:MAG: hypothetical protein D6731_17900 [Planctomycetota bacterium]